MKNIIRFVVLLCCFPVIIADAAPYGVARSAAPVLNIPRFSPVFGGTDGGSLATDRCGQVRELEFIALPGTSFRILGESRDGDATIFRVETDDYPVPAGSQIYVDSRFIELREDRPLPRGRRLPPEVEIISVLKGAIGSPYVWGGNVRGGVPELLEFFYGDRTALPAENGLTLAGLDCSGLLYQASGGWTPRNTSRLVSYGRAVKVAGRTADEIAALLDPLDLIVWNGHVVIVLDRDTVIESRLECGRPGNGGVKTTALRERLADIMRTRRPADHWPAGGKQRDVFVVRRWFALP